MASVAAARERLQGLFEGSIGYTDNVQGTPEHPPPDSDIPPASGDAFAILTPGVLFAIEKPNQTQRLEYSYTAHIYADQWSSNGYSNQLEWEGFFLHSRYLELVLSAGATQSHHHTAQTLSNASATALNAAFPGTSPFLLARVSEGLAARPWYRWTLRQGTGAALQTPVFPGIDAPTSFEWFNRLGAERSFRHDAVGVEAGTDYTLVSGAVDEDGRELGQQAQLISSVVGRWRHDLARRWSTQLDAGAMHVWKITADSQFWHPTGLALLGYTRREGDASILYRHGARTDLFLGLTFLVDEVSVRGSIPVDEDDDVVIQASAGYQHNRLIDEEGDLATELDVWLADVGVTWRVQSSVRLGLRFQHIDQESQAELPPLPLDFTRNTLLATAAFEYPPETRMPRTYRPPRRVDRGDDPLREQSQQRSERR